MKNDLNALNEKEMFVVFDTKTNAVVLETESEIEARAKVNYTANTEYSTYPPYTYAKNKKDLADLYESTLLEY